MVDSDTRGCPLPWPFPAGKDERDLTPAEAELYSDIFRENMRALLLPASAERPMLRFRGPSIRWPHDSEGTPT